MPNSELLTITAERSILGTIVYGLHDRLGLFYVGKTRNPANRFFQHRADRMNLHLARRLKQAGDELRVEIIALDPPSLKDAEGDAIAQHGARLVNVARNPYRLPTGMHVPLDGSKTPTAICPTCEGPMTQANSRHCRTCVGKLLAPAGLSKAELRELLAKVAPRL